jgi:hypothetical protein
MHTKTPQAGGLERKKIKEFKPREKRMSFPTTST